MIYNDALDRAGDTSLVSLAGGRKRYAVFTLDGEDVRVRLSVSMVTEPLGWKTRISVWGGYNSASTRDALNALLPAPLHVHTHQRMLYLHGAGDQIAVTDGMVVVPGRVLKTGQPVPLDMTLRSPPNRPSRSITYCLDRDTGLVVSKLGVDYAWPVLDFAGMSPHDGFQTHYNLELITAEHARNHRHELGIIAATHVSPELRLVHQAFWIEQRKASHGTDRTPAGVS